MQTHLKNPDEIKEPVARDLVRILWKQQQTLNIESAILQHNFPLYVSAEGELRITQVMVISREHGVFVFAPATLTNQSPDRDIEETFNRIDDIIGGVFAKFAKERNLRNQQSRVYSAIFAPLLEKTVKNDMTIPILRNEMDVLRFIGERAGAGISDRLFKEMVAALEMSKGLRQPKRRDIKNRDSKGAIAADVEYEIATFDRGQVDVFLNEIAGPERIKGLAGSGKTVVLAVKAAILHAFYPEKRIVFTYFTKSLHQHIVRLITTFYRAIHDDEPDWNNLRVMHAWGGRHMNGFYYEVCKLNGAKALSVGTAAGTALEPFDFACTTLLERSQPLEKSYDYVFVDEGQDVPSSFLRMADAVVNNHQVVWAFDALQNIFDVKAPTAEEIFDNVTSEQVLDETLKKCYRNPSEILITAHALGFGIYGKIVQMLENQEYWEDLGYELKNGQLVEGQVVNIYRPPENSLETISRRCKREEIVNAVAFADVTLEVRFVAESIVKDIREQELRPDDILVVLVDSKNASGYLDSIEELLNLQDIKTHNLRTDPMGGKQFFKEGHVTLSTVRRAKGNEAYMVYVMGADAMFYPYPTPISRNSLFTAMTRAKGWVTVTGCGSDNPQWKREIEKALSNVPELKFTYPSSQELVVMRHALRESKQIMKRSERADKVLTELSDEEILAYVEQRRHAKQKLQQFTDSLAARLQAESQNFDLDCDDYDELDE